MIRTYTRPNLSPEDRELIEKMKKARESAEVLPDDVSQHLVEKFRDLPGVDHEGHLFPTETTQRPK